MHTKKVLLIKYGEIALRKGNRTHFEHHLLDAIRHNLQSYIATGEIKVSREQGRFLVESPIGSIDHSTILPKIKHIFGLTQFCDATKTTDTSIVNLANTAIDYINNLNPHNIPQSFKVITKRSDKSYPMQSGEISAEIGAAICAACPHYTVDLHNPDVTLWIELRNHVYMYSSGVAGHGGLPYATNGKGIVLLSGGFDSPVAAYLAARRGVHITCAYFHSPPFVSERALDKVKDLTKELSKFTGEIKLAIVPFTNVQLFLKNSTHPEKLTILLKRAMLHIATRLATETDAHCLITGDSIGQVASQTMHSIAAVNSASPLTILRPLSTMDKQQIIDIAREIETYDISVRPYDDCCTLFVAKHPENKPSTKAIEKIETSIFQDLSPLISEAFENIEYFSTSEIFPNQ